MSKWIEIVTPYRTIKISPDGRQVIDEIHQSVKKSPHTTALINYVKRLYDDGVERINCDHTYFDFLDRTINLNRGKRKLDIVYYKNGQMYECELKGPREVGLDRTWKQVAEQAQHCNTLTLLVPLTKIEFCREQINLLKLENVVVDTYEDEQMGFLYQLQGSPAPTSEECTGKYPWWDKKEMEQYPLDLQEWAKTKRIDNRMWQWDNVLERKLMQLRRAIIAELVR